MSTLTRCIPLLLFTASLHSTDPPVPPGGFNVLASTTTITFSDGVVAAIDFYVPDALAGPTGWPGVLAQHGSDGTKNNARIVAIGNYLAAAGYVVYAYTAPSRTTQERAFLDTAEAHGLAQAAIVGTTIDPVRLAMTGTSGGGVKSFAAAAYSGKLLPLAGFVTHYPLMSAVAPEYALLDSSEAAVPGGTLAADRLVIGKPATDPVVAAIAAGDYATVQTLLDSSFNQSVMTEMTTSTVPILAQFAMQDFKITNNATIDALMSLHPGPKRIFMSTSGHSTVANAMEGSVLQDMRRRWFDRFLKGIPNGADLEPLAEIGMQPESTALHLDPATIWEHRQAFTWPPALSNDRFHLVSMQGLSGAPPVAADSSNVVDHVVPAGYDINAYIDLGGPGAGGGLEPGTVVSNIVPSVETFGTLPLSQTIEIIGRPTVRLTVDDTTGYCQLTAVLGHTDPGGVTHWITAGTAGVRSGVAGPADITIDLGDVAQVVPQGNSLRLAIKNVADINAPNSRRIRMVPYFTSTATTIQIDPANDNYLDLPTRPYQAALLPRLAKVSATGGFAHTMELRGGAVRAFQNYFVAVSCTGEAPGLTINGMHVPLNFDSCTSLGLGAMNTPILPNTMGVLDAFGNATPPPSFGLPAVIAPIFAGFRMTFVAFVLDAGGNLEVVGGPSTLVIE